MSSSSRCVPGKQPFLPITVLPCVREAIGSQITPFYPCSKRLNWACARHGAAAALDKGLLLLQNCIRQQQHPKQILLFHCQKVYWIIFPQNSSPGWRHKANVRLAGTESLCSILVQDQIQFINANPKSSSVALNPTPKAENRRWSAEGLQAKPDLKTLHFRKSKSTLTLCECHPNLAHEITKGQCWTISPICQGITQMQCGISPKSYQSQWGSFRICTLHCQSPKINTTAPSLKKNLPFWPGKTWLNLDFIKFLHQILTFTYGETPMRDTKYLTLLKSPNSQPYCEADRQVLNYDNYKHSITYPKLNKYLHDCLTQVFKF